MTTHTAKHVSLADIIGEGFFFGILGVSALVMMIYAGNIWFSLTLWVGLNISHYRFSSTRGWKNHLVHAVLSMGYVIIAHS